MGFLEALPFDIYFEISKCLDLDDISHLTQTCRQLHSVLDVDVLTRRAVEANHAYSEEARDAREGIITYKEALCAIYDRRHAFSNAWPFSARVIGHGSSFLYRQGVVCVMRHSKVYISNLRTRTPVLKINVGTLLESDNSPAMDHTYGMLYYNDDILAVHVARPDGSSLINFVRTENKLDDTERNMGCIEIGSPDTRLFVRHTAQHICFGMHNGRGTDGHRKWIIQTYKMDAVRINLNRESEEVKGIVLQDFHGNDIGSTVAFEIHDGHFYAVSNQGTYEVEEIDWTSFYHCVRIPLDDPVEEALQRNTRLYRRQHADGPIHDSWTDLVLQHSEKTNDLYIVESRREWVESTSRHARTFYTSRIKFNTAVSEGKAGDTGCFDDNQATPFPLPENDPLTTALASSHRANFMHTPKQYSWTRHSESLHMSCKGVTPRPFILARTKFRAYNLSCSAFVDLVEDANCCPGRLPSQLPCLRLRIGSRRMAPRAGTSSGYDGGESTGDHSLVSHDFKGDRVQFQDDTQYRYTPIRMWPPTRTDCPCTKRIHHIMNPEIRSDLGIGSDKKTITAVCDERSIVYMVKPSRSYQDRNTNSDGRLGTIVLVDFGRPLTSASKASRNDEWRSEWTKDRHRCEEGTC
ncbi:F-box domain-containing protein [Stagonosporopsis vannaccii]|nr:F-box domain-containing protein [Stagonosporopsis vannaccii]